MRIRNEKLEIRNFGFALLLFVGVFFGAVSAAPLVNLKGTMSVNQGSLGYSVDLSLPPGIAGVTPKLSLTYSSSGGNGYLGKGWSVSGMGAITRCGATKADDNKIRGIKFDSDDHYCLDGKRLVPVEGDDGAAGAEYRTLLESDSKIVSVGDNDGDPDYWVVYTKSGDIYTYGNSTGSRRVISGNNLSWQLSQIADRYDNAIDFTYETDNAAGYSRPKRVVYGNGNAVVFHYSNREDAFHGFAYGSHSTMTQKLDHIEVKAHGTLARTYKLGYKPQASSLDPLLLTSLEECASDGGCTEPLKFDWEGESGKFFEAEGTFSSDYRDPHYFADLNNDGLQDYIQDTKNYMHIYINNGDKTFSKVKTISQAKVDQVKFGDFNGDGEIDFLYSYGNYLYVVSNLGDESFSAPKKYAWDSSDNCYTQINDGEEDYTCGPDASYMVADFDGDGISDVLFKKYSRTGNNYYRKTFRSETIIMTGSKSGTFHKATIATNPDDSESLVSGSRDMGIYRENYYKGFMIVDFNNDGLPDILWKKEKLLLNSGNLVFEEQSFNYPEITNMNPAGYLRFADFNGDGIVDIMRKGRQEVDMYWVNDGTGHLIRIKGIDFRTKHNHAIFMDINGDGKADIYDYSQFHNGDDIVFMNDGNNSFVNKKALALSNYLTFADIDGDGYTDILETKDDKHIYLNKNRPYRITRITDSFGNTAEISYGRLSDPTVYTKGTTTPSDKIRNIISSAIQVVSSTKVSDGMGGSNTQSYHYTALRSHQFRGSLGFEGVTMYDATSHVKSQLTYYQDYPLTGMVKASASYLMDESEDWLEDTGELLSQSTATFEVVPQSVNQRIRTVSKVDRSYMEGSLLKTTTTAYTDYDSYGNVKEMKTTIEGGGATFAKTTQSTYDNDEERWILARLLTATVTHTGYGDTQSRQSAFSYGEHGTLESETIAPGDTLEIRKRYSYDTHGNKVSESILNTQTGERRTTTYTYDSNGEYITRITNALGHTVINLAHDPLTGKVTHSRDANGLESRVSYNVWGQQTGSKSADGTVTTLHYALDSSRPHSYYRISSVTTLPGGMTLPGSAIYYDSLGRKVSEQSVRFDGEKIWVDYEYDHKGRVIRQSSPYTADELPLYSEHTYDKYDREISVTTPAPQNIGGYLTSTVSYEGYTATSTNAKGETKSTTKNAMDKIISLTDEAGTTLYYDYDALGNLTQTRFEGSPNRTITMAYNTLGKKSHMVDPDMGEWEYGYNGYGELIYQKDANGNESHMTYDALGRLVTKTTPDGISSWVYDTADHGIGLLASESHDTEAISRVYTYDSLSRPLSTLTTIAGKTYTQTSTYDSHGRLAKTTQPKGLALINSYNDAGFMESIKSPAPQIQGFDREHFEGLLSDMKDQAANYKKRYEEAAKSYDTLFKRASYYQALADKYGASATRLQAIADELSSKASRMEAYMYRAKDAFFKELQRIQTYTSLANQFKKEWIGTGLAGWLSDYHNSIRDYTHSWISRILLLVLSPTPNHQDYQSYASNLETEAHKNLAQVESMLTQVLTSYQQMRYYESLKDADTAFQEMIDDTAYTYHYKLLQTDSHGRVTSTISGNGLINSNTYDDSGAMISSKTGYTPDTLLRDLAYEYDALYNQSKRVDNFLGVTATYQYDELSRIEHAHFDMSRTDTTEDLYYEYDSYGNLTHKEGQGDYHYSTTHPNRLLSTDQRTFEYDANGNMLKNGDTTLEYNAANKVTTITTNSGTTTFAYDMNQHRYQKTTDDTITTYLGKTYEHIENTEYGFTEDKYFIYAGGKVVAVYSEYHGTRYEHTIAYLHHDSLGSVDTITNAQGEVVQRSAYKPFGERITIEQSGTERAITNRGYTGHEEIEGTNLVHANARIYDPTLGRFMSADTLIQDPYDTQSYNRYAYVRNNPLKYTDPSGHSFMSIIKALIVAVVVIAVTVATLGASTVASLGYFGALKAASIGMLVKIGAIAGFAGSFTSAILSGASPGQALIAGATGALIGAVTAGLSNRIAGVLGHTGNYLRRAIAHGIVSGMMNMVRGGNFGSGFMSTFFSTIAGGIKVGAGWIQGAFQTLVGGTASVIGGGKFANGAVSAAMVWMFNDMSDPRLNGRGIPAAMGGDANKHFKSVLKISATRALSLLGGGLQAGTGIILITTGAGAPLGYWLVTLGGNNMISAVSGYNPMQEAITAATGSGQAGKLIYMTVDLSSSGAALMVKTVKLTKVSFGTIMHTERAYQSMSRGQMLAEVAVDSNTLYSGTKGSW